MSKVYIYHHNDHDGIVAAGILYNFLIKNDAKDSDIIFNMIDYDKELKFDHIDFNHDDRVYFLDYSFSSKHNQDEFEKLLKRRNYNHSVVWIDHHKTSIGLFEVYDINGIRCTDLCAAALTYLIYYGDCVTFSEFHNDPTVPTFLKYIDDYDCHKLLYNTTNDFHYGLSLSDPRDPIITKILDNDGNYSKGITCNIVLKGTAIQEYLNFDNKNYHIDMYGFEFTLPKEHGGLKCFCLNRKGNSIMFGDKYNEYDAVIPFYFKNGKWTYSIFSDKEDIDCSAIAKTYGGGGHKGAAGWVSEKFIFND